MINKNDKMINNSDNKMISLSEILKDTKILY